MNKTPNDSQWAGYPAPKETLLGYAKAVLDNLDSCSRIHYSYTNTGAPTLRVPAVNFYFGITWIFDGILQTTASFDQRWQQRSIGPNELLLSGTGGWYLADYKLETNRALAILFYPQYTRLVLSEFVNGEIVQNPYYHTEFQAEELEMLPMKLILLLMNEPQYSRKARVLLAVKLLLMQLIHDIESTPPKKMSSSNKLVMQMQTYCLQYFQLPINTEDVCSSLRVSRNYASTLFHHQTGLLLKDYLLALRMEKAEWLLKYFDYSIDEIAHQCGFSGANYFIRTFNKVHGVTPRTFRQIQRQPQAYFNEEI